MKKPTYQQLQTRLSATEDQLDRIFQSLAAIRAASQILDAGWEELDLWRMKHLADIRKEEAAERKAKEKGKK
jgi:hypothetical protein